LIRDGDRFPACAKLSHGFIVWIDASAGEGRSERIMLQWIMLHWSGRLWSGLIRSWST